MVRDITIMMQRAGYALGVRFKAIKQDPRIERAEARGDGTDRGASRQGGSDWSLIGDVPSSIMSPFTWYRRFMAFFPNGRNPTDPFFLSRDQVRPYTYTAAMSDLKKMLARVGDDVDFGLHGLRVEGYNRAKETVGEELTVAHGRWRSTAHLRYERFSSSQVLSLSSMMMGVESPYGDASVVAAQGRLDRQEVVRGSPGRAAAAAGGAGSSNDPLEPQEEGREERAASSPDTADRAVQAEPLAVTARRVEEERVARRQAAAVQQGRSVARGGSSPGSRVAPDHPLPVAMGSLVSEAVSPVVTRSRARRTGSGGRGGRGAGPSSPRSGPSSSRS